MKRPKTPLVFLLCVSMIFQGLACGNPEGGTEKDGKTFPAETDYYIIKDGRCPYAVVLPESPQGMEKPAAEELAGCLLKITGEEVPVVSEKDEAFLKGRKVLAVGDTKLAENNGITLTEKRYGSRGFTVKEKDGNVFLLGNGTPGTMNAVCEFLHLQFGYEPYSGYMPLLDEISLDTDIKDRKLLKLDLCENPDFEFVETSCHFNGEAARRMRFSVSYNDVFVNSRRQGWGHNTFRYVRPDVYNDPEKPDTYHPKWFTANGSQLHYTAHGDDEELRLLQDRVFKEITADIEAEFSAGHYYEYVSFFHEDSHGRGVWAKSDRPFGHEGMDSVVSLRDTYGNAYPAAMQLKFINPIADRLKAYMDEKWGGRKMNITVFAYQDTEAPPVVKKEGKYVPVDESVRARPNVNIMLAPIYGDYIRDYDEAGISELFEAWSAIADELSLYCYNYYHANSMIYFDGAYSLQSLYRAAKKINTVWLYNESPYQKCCNPFGNLRLYLTSKLGWDTELDVNGLTDAFFENYFKAASGHMREYFEMLRTHTAYLKNHMNLDGLVFSVRPDAETYWPLGLLKQFTKMIERAYDDLEPLKKTSPELYRRLYDRVLNESLMPRFLLLKNYAKEAYGDDAEFNEAVASFKADCGRLDITKWGASPAATIEELEFAG